MKADLHCHSTCSDGKLSPSDLVARAETRRVALLALTDHDTTSGLAEAARRAEAAGIKFVPGVEISVTWRGESIHVVGLQIDPAHPPLREGLAALRARRLERAARIASRLQSLGIPASLEGASAHAAKGDLIGRAHFARYLVASGHARDLPSAFRQYLAAGRPAYEPQEGAALDEAVAWIRGSGGVAVLAHPGRYGLEGPQRDALFEAFRDAGGSGVEVVSPSHGREDVARYARLAKAYGLYASLGSDFHAPGEGRRDLGDAVHWPDDCTPIWRTW